MNRYLLIFLLIPLVGAGKEKAKHTLSRSQIETVKDWLKTEGIQSSEEVSVCNNNADARFPLGPFSIQWPQAIYTNMLCLRNVGFIRNRDITPDGPTYSVNPYGETVVGPVLQKEKGTETMRVVEIPVETATRYKAVYNRKEDKGIIRDTVQVQFRIHYFMNTRALPYGYLAAVVPRSEEPELLNGRDFLENFVGYIIGLKFDGTQIDIPKEPRGNIPKKNQQGWQGKLRSHLKYTDGHQDWDSVEIYRLTPSGEFGKLVVRLK